MSSMVASGACQLIHAAKDVKKESILDPWVPIKNVEDAHVQHIAKYAVAEFNKESKANLKYKCVERGWTKEVEGVEYRLIIEAIDEDGKIIPHKIKKYEAIVWEKTWENFLKLLLFVPLVLE